MRRSYSFVESLLGGGPLTEIKFKLKEASKKGCMEERTYQKILQSGLETAMLMSGTATTTTDEKQPIEDLSLSNGSLDSNSIVYCCGHVQMRSCEGKHP
jgi:hypothetical protein